MKNNKYFILLFQYHCILLYTEIDGKITRIPFSNKKKKLSNCVTFSYDKEDLEFLPDGDPFEVNKNSPFSDYLDFAGYNFSTEQALEVIVTSLIDKNLIPNLNKGDDIFICTQVFYFEVNPSDESDVILSHIPKTIKGHRIFVYDCFDIFNVSADYLRKVIGKNIIFGFPFLAVILSEHGDVCSMVTAPTIEIPIVEKVNEKYPLPTHIPEKLLRNIRNRIIVAKLFNLPLPDTAIYQNRKFEIALTKFAKRFDEIINETCKYFLEHTKRMDEGETYIFDYGMHPHIKETFVKLADSPVFVKESANDKLISLLLRNMIIEHIAINNLQFKSRMLLLEKSPNFRKDDVFRSGNKRFYDIELIGDYYSKIEKSKVLDNIETKDLKKEIKGD